MQVKIKAFFRRLQKEGIEFLPFKEWCSHLPIVNPRFIIAAVSSFNTSILENLKCCESEFIRIIKLMELLQVLDTNVFISICRKS